MSSFKKQYQFYSSMNRFGILKEQFMTIYVSRCSMKKVGTVPDPSFAMSYYVKKEGIKPLSADELAIYVRQNYSPYIRESRVELHKAANDKEVLCALDQINGQLIRESTVRIPKTILKVMGWGLDKAKEQISDESYIILRKGNEVYSLIMKRHERPDVAKHLKLSESYKASGFSGEGSIVSMPVGTYQLSLVQRRDAKFVSCAFPVNLEIYDQTSLVK